VTESDCGVLGYDTVFSCSRIPFSGDMCCLHKRCLSINFMRSLNLNLEAIFTSETSLIYKTTRHENSEDNNGNNHRFVNH
jgi:hypothetical protein